MIALTLDAHVFVQRLGEFLGKVGLARDWPNFLHLVLVAFLSC